MWELRELVGMWEREISIARQCELLGLSRSTYYYEAKPESAYNLVLMQIMDEQYLETPFYGYRRMHRHLVDLGYEVNQKRVLRLWRLMGYEAIYPKPRTSERAMEHRVYPYLLRNVAITRSNQVWSSDITFIPMATGYWYLVAVMDWYSRAVLSFELSNTMSVEFCLVALDRALRQYGKPEIFNTDQGSQFTSLEFTGLLASQGIAISMDGRGRALDNVFIERLWRSVKHEHVYLHRHEYGLELQKGLEWYFEFYNKRRPHQGLSGEKPYWVYQLSLDGQHRSRDNGCTNF